MYTNYFYIFFLHFFLSFLLLTFQIFYSYNVILSSIIWFSYSLTLRKIENNNLGIISIYKAKFTYFETVIIFIVFAILSLNLFIYTYPTELSGDAQKAYSALSKFYAVFNKIIINEPAQTTEPLIAFGFPHGQEIFLSVGYLLGQNVGQKLFAFSIIISKLLILFCISKQIFKFSNILSLVTVLLFATTPIGFELNNSIRPENLLTGIFLLSIFLYEYSFQNKAFKVHTFLIFLASIIFLPSIKYTGIQLLFSNLVVYSIQLIKTLFENFKNIVKYSFLIIPFIVITLFWYLRNFIEWGFIFKIYPWDQDWVECWYPALKSIMDFIRFISCGFIETQRYTEFPNLGYGLLGIMFIPALLWGIFLSPYQHNLTNFDTRKLEAPNYGFIRRISLIISIYIILMLLSTKQIRYLAPVIPLIIPVLLSFFIAIYTIISRADFISGFISKNLQFENLKKLTFCILIFSHITLSAYTLNKSELGASIRSKQLLGLQDLNTPMDPFNSINKFITYKDLILAPFIDSNYSFDANIFRGDNLQSLAVLKETQEKYKFNFWLFHTSNSSVFHNFFFNDLSFLKLLSTEVVSSYALDNASWGFTLLKPLTNKINELEEFCKLKGWDLNNTYIVSNKIKNQLSTNLLTSKPFKFPFQETSELYYKVYAYWDPFELDLHLLEPDKLIQQDFSPSWFFEDIQKKNYSNLYYFNSPKIYPFAQKEGLQIEKDINTDALKYKNDKYEIISSPDEKTVTATYKINLDKIVLNNIKNNNDSMTNFQYKIFIRAINSTLNPQLDCKATVNILTDGRKKETVQILGSEMSTDIDNWIEIEHFQNINFNQSINIEILISSKSNDASKCGFRDLRFISYNLNGMN